MATLSTDTTSAPAPTDAGAPARPDPRIALYGEQVLRSVAAPVTFPIDEKVVGVVETMAGYLTTHPGVYGVSAPQLRASLRVVMVRGERRLLGMINPTIEILDRRTEPLREGCASLPGVFAFVPRAVAIRARFLDAEGAEHALDAADLLARAIQHEVDHLDGVLLLDRIASDIVRRRSMQRLRLAMRHLGRE